ncbi:15681_t:CDS:2 [Funneliformis mosseae]|uniref:15681_t:CDS:1 n=1 Tax=Funneliformis mosseae TaxID=27381 RepID=A0A9N9CXJ8_FUNMO|nr:15681_t:CDS:2 [Funneliformis mosseae]
MRDRFQRMFDESGFDIYMHYKLDLDVSVPRLTKAENAIVNR